MKKIYESPEAEVISFAAMEQLATNYPVRNDISVSLLSRMPEVFTVEKPEVDEEALKNDLFREICSSATMKLEYGNPPYTRWLKNTNKLLTMYDGIYGVKTGFTKASGRCLVGAAERDGALLISVTLSAPNDWNDHISLFHYGFSLLGVPENTKG